MNDLDLTIGKILSKLESLEDDVKEMRLELKELNRFKWKVTGYMSIVMGTLVVGFEIFMNYVRT